MLFDSVIGMAIGHEESNVSVIVVIKELSSPTAHETCGAADTQWAGHVVKGEVSVVVVQGIHFLIDACHEQVLPTILGVVGRLEAHARTRAAFLAIGNSRPHA